MAKEKRELKVNKLVATIIVVTLVVIATLGGVSYNKVKSVAKGEVTERESSQAMYATALQTWSYSYSGTYKTLTIPTSAYYKLEAWGAQGGQTIEAKSGYDNAWNGGEGAYVTGTVYLNAGTMLYIFVGGKSEDEFGGYNGGGGGTRYTTWSSRNILAGGGGASDIRIGGTSLYRRVIVAAGGAGGSSVGQRPDLLAGGAENSFGAFPAGQSYAGQGGSFGQGGSSTRMYASSKNYYLIGGRRRWLVWRRS